MPISLYNKKFCRECIHFTPSEVLNVMTKKITISWDATPCNLAEAYKYFGGTYFFHFQIRIAHPTNKKGESKQSRKIILTTYFEIGFIFYMSYTRTKPIKNKFVRSEVSRWGRVILWSSAYQTTRNYNTDYHNMATEFDEHISVKIPRPKFNRNLFNIFWDENYGLRVSYYAWILCNFPNNAQPLIPCLGCLSGLLVGHISYVHLLISSF
jgi:hypothetical protein